MPRVTILVENTAAGTGLLAEHGLSFWVEHDGHRVLFDTGQGHVLANNAGLLGIPLCAADAVVLSHGHFDHTGGLKTVLADATPPAVFLHPAALEPKYARRSDGSVRNIGMPHFDEARLRQKTRLVFTEGPTEVCPGVYVTGPVPRGNEFEDKSGPYFVDAGCREADTFPDDQALYFETGAGTVVVLGCAHAGVINTLRHVQQLTDNRPLHTVAGGMHLGSASPDRLARTLEALRGLAIQRLAPVHCTGFTAMARLWQEFPDAYTPCCVGTVLEIGS